MRLTIHLTIPTSSKAVEVPILAQEDIMMPASVDSFDLHSICKHFNRLLRVDIHRVSDAELPVLVEADRVDLTALGEEDSVKLASCNLLQPFTVKVRIVSILWHDSLGF